MGVVSHIVVTATEAKEEKKMEELEEVAAVIMEALLVCEQNEGDGQSRAALKVHTYVHMNDHLRTSVQLHLSFIIMNHKIPMSPHQMAC